MPRLDHLLARNLKCSRARARALLESAPASEALDPRQELAGADLPRTINLGVDTVVLHDRVDLVLNKPAGCVTALRDGMHRAAVWFVRDAPLCDELRPAGRLDLDTTGLLIWTTDGTWLHRITHPRRQIPRTYHAALARPFALPPAGFTLEDGHRPEISELKVMDVAEAHPTLARPSDARVFASITITGGAYHEVRRIFAALGSHVVGLCRVAYGKLVLPGDLEPGKWRMIKQEDV